jgi:hypothetical protein
MKPCDNKGTTMSKQAEMPWMENIIPVDFTPKPEVSSETKTQTKPFDMDAWHQSLGGCWQPVAKAN